MPRISRLIVTLAMLCMLLGLPSSSFAQTVPKQTDKVCDSYNSKTNWGPRNLQVPQFDPALGTLTAVTVSQQVNVGSSYTLTSDDNGAITVTFNGNASIELKLGSNPSVTAQLSAGNKQVGFAGIGTASGILGPESKATNISPTDLLNWIGKGYVQASAQAKGSITAQADSGNVDTSIRTNADAQLCVVYSYNVEVVVCIGDYVWYDTNQNGIQDPTETGVSGSAITVRDAQGNVLGKTVTDASGRWLVCQLEPNTACVISVDLPVGWSVTTLAAGSDRALDSNGIPNGSSATIPCVTPPSGSDLTFDVGIYNQPPDSASFMPATSFKAAKSVGAKSISSRGKVVFYVAVKNTGKYEAHNVAVCDTPPGQLSFISKPKGSFVSQGRLCWTVRKLKPGSVARYRYVMRAAAVAKNTCVVNSVTAATKIDKPSSATARTCVRAAAIKALPLAG